MENCELIGDINKQLGFIKFLTDKNLMDFFSTEYTTIRHPKGSYSNDLPIDIDDKKKLVTCFYGKTFGLVKRFGVFSIMHRFNKKFDVKIIAGRGKSYVKVNEDKKVIKGEVYTTPTIQGFETIAHEIAHSLTGRNNKEITLLNKVDNAKTQHQRELAECELECFRKEKYDSSYDAIGEIETMSIEKLFLKFLSEDKKSSRVLELYNGFNIDEYIKEYEKEHENVAYERMQTIIETKKMLDKYNISEYFKNGKEFEIFLSQLNSDSAREEFKQDMEQIAETKAEYNFRYIAGEAISKYWFDKFQVAEKKERKELKDKFTQFWHGTDKLDIEQASALLCDGKTFNEVISIYFEKTQIHKNASCKTM